MQSANSALPRLLLKLSGEALGGDAGQGIDPAVLGHFCRQIKGAVDAGIELGVVLGGGNLFRGATLSEAGMDRIHSLRICDDAYYNEGRRIARKQQEVDFV